MKVLLLAPGQSVHTHKWAESYLEQGIELKVATFYDHYKEEHAQQVDTIRLPKILPGKASYLSSLFALKKLIQEFQPDFLHAHYLSSYGLVGALTHFHPFFLSVWGSDIYLFPNQGRFNQKIVEYTLRRADRICSTSHAMAEEIQKYTQKEIKITPFGVDIERFQPNEDPKSDHILTIGIVKGLKDIYGIPELIKTFARLEKEFGHVRLLIVGDGPERERYERLAQDLQILDKVTFTGYIPNHQVVSYYHQIDIFVLPSKSESFGVAALEAQACGIPVVVSAVGGLPEVVRHEETGMIVSQSDPEELFQAIRELVTRADLRKQMGRRGVEFVKQNFSWSETSKRMVTLYHEYRD